MSDVAFLFQNGRTGGDAARVRRALDEIEPEMPKGYRAVPVRSELFTRWRWVREGGNVGSFWWAALHGPTLDTLQAVAASARMDAKRLAQRIEWEERFK